jgi:UPF0755 protein
MLRRLLAFAAVVLVGLGSALGWLLLTPGPALREGPRVVEIPAHEGALAIAARLHEAGVVRSRLALVALGAVQGHARRLKAGEYEFPQGATTPDVLRLIATGAVRQHAILHPEGGTVAELARMLEVARLASAADVTRVATDPAFLRSLDIAGPSVEGYLFPDTYHLVRGMSAEEILTRMVQRLRAKLTPDIRARAAERRLGVHELLTLASIIEREAVIAEERPLISAVFWNRLQRDMPLQADPTVQYAVRKERGTLSRADLQVESPFNTYRRSGLPPGPIASPGLSAIAAALHPAPVGYLYFVAIDDRRHHFSTTVEQHNAAVLRYRQGRGRS